MIEKITGRAWERSVEQRILKPLHLNETTFEPAQQAELTRTTAVSPGYGLGLFVEKRPCGATILGHPATFPASPASPAPPLT
ncbi:beta-lactamase [Lentzea atacamensis]|uniref:Beta-lactamase n=1 Tax=Lentzea atacamensis TaxID=531938 RepID=A0ABX9E971_9PSEU|nr:beta-lactamase [Lentzea atacamensis]